MSSSRTGSAPSTRVYHCLLASMSVTVIATWVTAGIVVGLVIGLLLSYV